MITKPTSSWRELLNQRIRWASNTKWQISLNPEFFFYLLSVFGTVVLPFVLLFFHLQAAILILLLRIILEIVFIRRAGKYFLIPQKRFYFYPVWFVMQPFYVLFVSILGQLELFRWK